MQRQRHRQIQNGIRSELTLIAEYKDSNNMKGQWIRKTNNGLNVVFIHGINSSEECWRHKNGSYWPDLLKDESELAELGIYLFSYRTGINTGSYSLSDIVDSLREYFKLDNLIDSSGVIFVCHSMGGIVTRRFLVNQQSILIERGLNKIGLFLVASPSLGSEYANMLNLISIAMGHTQASALEFSQNNVWLNDLDKDFINLKTNKNLQIKGKELIEDLPLYGKGWIRKQIVEPFSGAKYFGDSFKVPGSDHITIATPDNRDALQHRLLVQFSKEFIEEYKPIISHERLKDISEEENLDKEIILNDSRKYKIVTLSASGSGKSVFLASMFRKLLIQSDINFFLNIKDVTIQKRLNKIFEVISFTANWPTGTHNNCLKYWNFFCCLQNKYKNIYRACEFSFLDYSASQLSDIDDELDIDFYENIDQSDAFICVLDGMQILNLMENNGSEDKNLLRFLNVDLTVMLQVMQRLNNPTYILISKWDILDGKFSLNIIRDHLLKVSPEFRFFVKSRLRTKTPIWLIPVSSVGKGFAEPRPDGSMAKVGSIPKPFQVEVPIVCFLSDKLMIEERKSIDIDLLSQSQIDQLLKQSLEEVHDEESAFNFVKTECYVLQKKFTSNFPASKLNELQDEI